MSMPTISKSTPIREDQSTSEAFGAILRHNFDYMRSWAPIAYSREDIEGVHQARVAFRRMRSALTLFRKAIPRHITDPVGTEMRWIASEMGPARDLDVFIDEGLEEMAGKIPIADGEKKLLEIAINHRDRAYERLREMMDSDRYKKFLEDFDKWLTDNGWFQEEMPAETRVALGRNIRPYAAKVMDKRLAKVTIAGSNIMELPDVQLHELRIECKKLRYATEFFSPLFDRKGMAEFTALLKGIQGLLGVLNDVAVMPGLVEKLLEGVEDRHTIQYAGALVGWRARQYEEIRGQLQGAWTNFANAPLPWSEK